MKKRLTLLLSSLVVAVALCIGVFAAPGVAYADEVTVVSVSAATDEFLYFGDVINSTAEVTLSNEQTEDRAIIWDNLNANEVNSLFSMAEAVGTVEGTDTRVSRRFFTLPRGLAYFVNCGSLTNQEDPGYNDVYYGLSQAIVDNYDGAPTADGKLLNKVPDRMITANDGYSGWGYTNYSASYASSSKQMPTKAGDPMPPAFPYNTIRATDSKDLSYGIQYTLGNLTAGVPYRIYLGTRSHWHGRRVTPSINGVDQPQLEITAAAKVTIYDNVVPATNDSYANSIRIWLKGANLDEGNCAFIAIQTMDEANKMATVAPGQITIGGNLEMGQTSFTVGNVAAGSKVQVSLAEAPYNILYEKIAEESGNFEITIPEERLEGVFSLYLTAVNTFGASKPTQVYITDITDFYFTPIASGFTSNDLGIRVQGKSDSGIMRLVVTHNYLSTTYDEAYDDNFGKQSYDGVVYVKENGLYTFTLYSGNNAFVSEDVIVSTIDKENVYLSVDMALTGFTGDKPRLAFSYVGAAPVASYIVYNEEGQVQSTNTGAMVDMELDYGRYVFAVTSESGKIATASAIVSEKPLYFTVAAKEVKNGVNYAFAGANGKTIVMVSAYSVSKSGIASLLMGSTSNTNNYSGNDVYVRVQYSDGTIEFNKLDVEVSPMSAGKKKGCGSAAGAASLPIALGALALCAVVIGVKRRAKAN